MWSGVSVAGATAALGEQGQTSGPGTLIQYLLHIFKELSFGRGWGREQAPSVQLQARPCGVFVRGFLGCRSRVEGCSQGSSPSA